MNKSSLFSSLIDSNLIINRLFSSIWSSLLGNDFGVRQCFSSTSNLNILFNSSTSKTFMIIFLFSSSDIMPFNITSSVSKSKGLTLMPTYGLNVYSMLKHNTLVLTVKSLDTIESKLLFYMNHSQFRTSELNKKENWF